MALRDYDIGDVKIMADKYAEYEQNISGWMLPLENDVEKFVLIIGNIKEYDQLYLRKDFAKHQEHYAYKAKHGDFDLSKIFYTQKFKKFYDILLELKSNPFLPKEIQEVAVQIDKDVLHNLYFHFRIVFSKYLKILYEAYKDDNSINYENIAKNINYQSILNDFDKERIKHQEKLDLLKHQIRKHLLIDKK